MKKQISAEEMMRNRVRQTVLPLPSRTEPGGGAGVVRCSGTASRQTSRQYGIGEAAPRRREGSNPISILTAAEMHTTLDKAAQRR
ncbi:hypothetical protein ACNQFN_00325 [Thauera butanivorans]|uniref:hypothetical protein n=1 Tax=Thauera butanivorans TaxID=86174 RepID=UPI003AB19B73